MKILIIDAGINFAHSKGQLNHYLSDFMKKALETLGHSVKLTRIETGYQASEEVEKILWADAVIYQQPGWWMGAPWQLKKYMDDVFTLGAGKLYANDGRTRSDPSRKYGSGGLIQGKKYMISATWNAPLEAFEVNSQFFEGKGMDAVYFPFHKANQFLGMEPLPSFLCNDVMKDLNLQEDLKRLQEHLQKVFPSE